MVKFIFLCFLFLCSIQCFYCVLLGGEKVLDINDPQVIRLSNVALLKINENKKGVGKIDDKAIKILSATRQVVSGILTKLVINVSENGEAHDCVVKIWEQPWLNKTEVTLAKCDLSTSTHLENEKNVQHKNEEKQKILLSTFHDFMREHNKVYYDEKEYKKRFRIFRANMLKIKMLRETEQGTGQYGITQFADMTETEFKKHLGFTKLKDAQKLPMAKIPNIELPNSFDWRHYNVVTPVKDQKLCGSCWAFSVTGNIEGQWALKNRELLSLSEQELVDCDTSDNGCGGGDMSVAYQSIMKLGGLETEDEYPYEAEREKCHFNKSEVRVKISGAVNITKSETEMAKWLVKNGPMSVGVNANAMQFYFGGVSHPLKIFCNPSDLDHGVLIVGFGVHHSRILHKVMPYWIVKNSWGKRWGEAGYYRLYRGDGSCGIDQMVTSAVIN